MGSVSALLGVSQRQGSWLAEKAEPPLSPSSIKSASSRSSLSPRLLGKENVAAAPPRPWLRHLYWEKIDYSTITAVAGVTLTFAAMVSIFALHLSAAWPLTIAALSLVAGFALLGGLYMIFNKAEQAYIDDVIAQAALLRPESAEQSSDGQTTESSEFASCHGDNLRCNLAAGNNMAIGTLGNASPPASPSGLVRTMKPHKFWLSLNNFWLSLKNIMSLGLDNAGVYAFVNGLFVYISSYWASVHPTFTLLQGAVQGGFVLACWSGFALLNSFIGFYDVSSRFGYRLGLTGSLSGGEHIREELAADHIDDKQFVLRQRIASPQAVFSAIAGITPPWHALFGMARVDLGSLKTVIKRQDTIGIDERAKHLDVGESQKESGLFSTLYQRLRYGKIDAASQLLRGKAELPSFAQLCAGSTWNAPITRSGLALVAPVPTCLSMVVGLAGYQWDSRGRVEIHLQKNKKLNEVDVCIRFSQDQVHTLFGLIPASIGGFGYLSRQNKVSLTWQLGEKAYNDFAQTLPKQLGKIRRHCRRQGLAGAVISQVWPNLPMLHDLNTHLLCEQTKGRGWGWIGPMLSLCVYVTYYVCNALGLSFKWDKENKVTYRCEMLEGKPMAEVMQRLANPQAFSKNAVDQEEYMASSQKTAQWGRRHLADHLCVKQAMGNPGQFILTRSWKYQQATPRQVAKHILPRLEKLLPEHYADHKTKRADQQAAFGKLAPIPTDSVFECVWTLDERRIEALNPQDFAAWGKQRVAKLQRFLTQWQQMPQSDKARRRMAALQAFCRQCRDSELKDFAEKVQTSENHAQAPSQVKYHCFLYDEIGQLRLRLRSVTDAQAMPSKAMRRLASETQKRLVWIDYYLQNDLLINKERKEQLQRASIPCLKQEIKRIKQLAAQAEQTQQNVAQHAKQHWYSGWLGGNPQPA